MTKIREFERQGLSKTEYNSIHRWVNRRTKHLLCSKCGKSGRIENALIKGKIYEKRLENFTPLCCSCHSKYDGTNLGVKRSDEVKQKYSEAKKGEKYAGKAIIDGFGKTYTTMTECADAYNLTVSSISAMIKNKQTNKFNLKQIKK